MLCRAWITCFGIVLAAAVSAPASFVHSILPSDGIGTNANFVSHDFTDKIGQDPGPFMNEADQDRRTRTLSIWSSTS